MPFAPCPLPADPAGLGWLPKDLNAGRLDLFFLVLGALMALNLLLYLRVASQYEYKAVEHVRRAVAPRRDQQQQQRPPLPRPPAPRPQAPLQVPSRAQAIGGAGAGTLPASSPIPSIYSRSVTFMPPSPAMPANRR